VNVSDLQQLEFRNIGSWPAPAKGVAIGFICVLVVGAGWYVDLQDQTTLLDQAEQKEVALKQDLESKQSKVINLDALTAQLEDIKQSFGDMLKRLPNRTEVAGLLVDISQQGLGAGLEFELFKPGNEQPADFYVELPIQIRVTGGYHQFGQFVSGVADLPRIVTQHDIHITAVSKAGQEGLVMESTAKTYRYLGDEDEAAAGAPAANDQKPASATPAANKPASPAAQKPGS
jgi:type IV pilus assembly protein PilO